MGGLITAWGTRASKHNSRGPHVYSYEAIRSILWSQTFLTITPWEWGARKTTCETAEAAEEHIAVLLVQVHGARGLDKDTSE